MPRPTLIVRLKLQPVVLALLALSIGGPIAQQTATAADETKKPEAKQSEGKQPDSKTTADDKSSAEQKKADDKKVADQKKADDKKKADELKKKVFDDPTKVDDPDFKLQGEYTGEAKRGDATMKVGVQVIAQGGGKFHAVLYQGGLPGDGWKKVKKQEFDGTLKNGEVRFELGDSYLSLKDDGITIHDTLASETVTLKRVERQSPTLGAKPPEGAIVLFDGKHADAWNKGQVTDDGLLKQGVTSKEKFGEISLHIEFRLPYQPYARGQGRGNSGIYLQGRYEVQMLDSFGLAGKDNECGGLYTIKAPDVNMCYPPLAWQTYDIDYSPANYKDGKKVSDATITVRHNGVLIHEKVELSKATQSAPGREGPDNGPVFLQDHGNPVRYRNIWVVKK